ncbi:hypothetical protein TELCIR_15021, partial [Teladorsagia circumcincta]
MTNQVLVYLRRALLPQSHFIHDVISYDKRIAQFHSNKICCFPEDDDVKFYVGSTEYDLKRTPSWCDRVLYKGDIISPVTYISNENVLVSDHIPVQAVFEMKVPESQATNWNVLFEHLPPWYTTVPLISRFQFRNNYWSSHGSYLDWAAVYP